MQLQPGYPICTYHMASWAPTAFIAGYSIKDQVMSWGLVMVVASVADVVLLLMLHQVMQDLLVDESTCTALVSYTLPQHTTKLSATLTARLLLALPGTNGEPDYQDFDIQALLPGQTCLQHRSVLCLNPLPDVSLSILTLCSMVLCQQLSGACSTASCLPCLVIHVYASGTSTISARSLLIHRRQSSMSLHQHSPTPRCTRHNYSTQQASQ